MILTGNFAEKLAALRERYTALIEKTNAVDPDFYNGVYERYVNPVLTGDHAPVEWQYDLNPAPHGAIASELGV